MKDVLAELQDWAPRAFVVVVGHGPLAQAVFRSLDALLEDPVFRPLTVAEVVDLTRDARYRPAEVTAVVVTTDPVPSMLPAVRRIHQWAEQCRMLFVARVASEREKLGDVPILGNLKLSAIPGHTLISHPRLSAILAGLKDDWCGSDWWSQNDALARAQACLEKGADAANIGRCLEALWSFGGHPTHAGVGFGFRWETLLGHYASDAIADLRVVLNWTTDDFLEDAARLEILRNVVRTSVRRADGTIRALPAGFRFLHTSISLEPGTITGRAG